jgi:hypothetical protein
LGEEWSLANRQLIQRQMVVWEMGGAKKMTCPVDRELGREWTKKAWREAQGMVGALGSHICEEQGLRSRSDPQTGRRE